MTSASPGRGGGDGAGGGERHEVRGQSTAIGKFRSTDTVPQCDLFRRRLGAASSAGAGLEDFTAELLAFPGRHDDQVDALTQGLAWGRSLWSQRARLDRRAVL